MATTASAESEVRRKWNMERDAPGAGQQADSTGSYKDYQMVRDFSRLSDKTGIPIFKHRGAHEYTLNTVFTPYLNL